MGRTKMTEWWTLNDGTKVNKLDGLTKWLKMKFNERIGIATRHSLATPKKSHPKIPPPLYVCVCRKTPS